MKMLSPGEEATLLSSVPFVEKHAIQRGWHGGIAFVVFLALSLENKTSNFF